MFVVLGECGEYEQRSVWVAGIYATKDEAETVMRDRLAKRRAFNAWSDAAYKHQRALDTRGSFGWSFPLSQEDNVEFESIRTEAERRAGPKPEYEPADGLELFEIPIGHWQNGIQKELLSLYAERPDR